MVQFAEINQAPPPYSMLLYIGRVATLKLVPRNCLSYLQTTLIMGGGGLVSEFMWGIVASKGNYVVGKALTLGTRPPLQTRFLITYLRELFVTVVIFRNKFTILPQWESGTLTINYFVPESSRPM